ITKAVQLRRQYSSHADSCNKRAGESFGCPHVSSTCHRMRAWRGGQRLLALLSMPSQIAGPLIATYARSRSARHGPADPDAVEIRTIAVRPLYDAGILVHRDHIGRQFEGSSNWARDATIGTSCHHCLGSPERATEATMNLVDLDRVSMRYGEDEEGTLAL